MTPFDFLNDINYGKKNLMIGDTDHQVEKQYLPFIVNKGLSYTMDTVLYANEMNIRPNTDKKLQFDTRFGLYLHYLDLHRLVRF
jgi:hypothetical protein